MGPQLDPALNPFGDGQPVYAPNYAAFYNPVTPAQYAAFSAELANYSYTQETLARAEITNSDLFKLPGGNAGLALLVEGGQEGWSYNPDPGFRMVRPIFIPPRSAAAIARASPRRPSCDCLSCPC